jgi:hypothetical protein
MIQFPIETSSLLPLAASDVLTQCMQCKGVVKMKICRCGALPVSAVELLSERWNHVLDVSR